MNQLRVRGADHIGITEPDMEAATTSFSAALGADVPRQPAAPPQDLGLQRHITYPRAQELAPAATDRWAPRR
jgi:hypothetical protein